VSLLLQASGQHITSGGCLARRSLLVPGLVIAAGQPVAAETAQKCGDRADYRRPGRSVGHSRHRTEVGTGGIGPSVRQRSAITACLCIS
jgi:hypothetical protein